MIPLFLVLQAAAGNLPAPPLLPYEDADAAAVMAPINGLVGAFDRGDAAAMMIFVHPNGRVTATGTRLSGSGLREQSWTEFAARITPASTFQETLSDPAIEIDGDIAMVWVHYVVRVGGKLGNCGIDHFDLARDRGVWKVVNLTFSARLTGCTG